MSDYEPKVGDRVRVTEVREGVVTDSSGDGAIWLDMRRSYFVGDREDGVTVTVERLPDPEPEWQPGDVVQVGRWATWLRIDSDPPRWQSAGGASLGRDEFSADWQRNPSDFRLIVRDGKPVQS